MTKFTRDELRNFRTDFEKAVSQLAEDYNIEIDLGNIGFTQNEFHGKITCVRNGKQDEIARKQFEAYCGWDGLSPEDFGKTFSWGKKTFTISGWNPRARKDMVVLKGADGKSYKATPEQVKAFIA